MKKSHQVINSTLNISIHVLGYILKTQQVKTFKMHRKAHLFEGTSFNDVFLSLLFNAICQHNI